MIGILLGRLFLKNLEEIEHLYYNNLPPINK